MDKYAVDTCVVAVIKKEFERLNCLKDITVNRLTKFPVKWQKWRFQIHFEHLSFAFHLEFRFKIGVRQFDSINFAYYNIEVGQKQHLSVCLLDLFERLK